MVADRMVSDADDSLRFEHEPKGQMLSYNARVITAGTMHEPEIIDLSIAEIAGRMKIHDMVETLAKHFRNVRRRRVETEILSKHGFMSFDAYHEKQKTLADYTIECIESELQSEETELDLAILFVGLDATTGKGQIYLIDDPGSSYSHTEVGFCCVGSGERHADPVFAFYGYNLAMRVEDVLYISYVAKRRAQMAGGVGDATDAWVLSKKGCYKVKQSTLDNLETRLRAANLADLQVDVNIEYEDTPELPDERG
jgi:hypothetical protein